MSHAAINKDHLRTCCENYIRWRSEEITRLMEQDIEDFRKSLFGRFFSRKFAIRNLEDNPFSSYNYRDMFQYEKKEIALRLITLCNNTTFDYVMLSDEHAFILMWD